MRPRVGIARVKALAGAFRWQRRLDTGVHATLENLARAKSVNATYVSRILRLTLLAPEIVEAIIEGRQPGELQLHDLSMLCPPDWRVQTSLVAANGRATAPAPVPGLALPPSAIAGRRGDHGGNQKSESQ